MVAAPAKSASGEDAENAIVLEPKKHFCAARVLGAAAYNLVERSFAKGYSLRSASCRPLMATFFGQLALGNFSGNYFAATMMAKISVLPTSNNAKTVLGAAHAARERDETSNSKIDDPSNRTGVNWKNNELGRNPGTRFDLDPVKDVRVNRSAIERRTATLGTRRTVKKDHQAAWLIHAVKTIDLTTLSGDDTAGTVKRLCAKAMRPIGAKLLADLGLTEAFATEPLQTGAVCVYHRFVATAVAALAGTGIPVAAVSTGFPAGLSPFPQKIEEIKASVKAGAKEIDIVISREHVLTGNWRALYDETKAFREACGDAHMKAIIATGELGTLKNIMRASIVCMQAGSDFIKTSTGKEPTNATLAGSLVMLRAIRAYHEQTGHQVGFKPAGGIRTAKQSLDWLMLMKEELGDDWLEPHLFRIGASALINDIERQLEHFAYGRYASMQYQALG